MVSVPLEAGMKQQAQFTPGPGWGTRAAYGAADDGLVNGIFSTCCAHGIFAGTASSSLHAVCV